MLNRIQTAAYYTLQGLLLALGWVWPLCSAFGFTDIIKYTLPLCILLGTCWVLGGISRLTAIGAMLLSGVGIAVLAMINGWMGQLPGFIMAVTLLITGGNSTALHMYAPMVMAILSIVFVNLSQLLVQRSAGLYPALAITLVLLLGIAFSGAQDAVLWAIPAMAGLIMLYARTANEATPPWRVLCMAGLATLLCVCVLPSQNRTLPRMEAFAQRIRDIVQDYLLFNEPRTVYTIAVDGYQPQGTRLGGPMQSRSDRNVMIVHTNRILWLRGVTRDEYTGALWQDTQSMRRYLYVDPRWRNLRTDLLDLARPQENLRDASLFTPVRAEIQMQSDSASTLFVPQRTQSLLCDEGMTPYFNGSGEIFLTRDVKAGDTYTVEAPVLDITDDRLSVLLSDAGQSGNGELSKDAYTAYTQLPVGIEPGIHELLNGWIEDANTPFLKVRAIVKHLRQSYRYTLLPDIPPSDRDFVSYFLLTGKEGYCTYYASAVVVLARIAGIPARYVEGYLATPDPNGIACVTGKNAHAWAEVHMPGFGWLTVDATPSEEGNGESNEMGSSSDAPSDHTDDEPSGSGEEPNQAPTPSPDKRSQPDPTPSPSPEPNPNDESITTPDVRTSSEQAYHSSFHMRWWWFLCLVLLVSACIAWYIWTCPTQMVMRESSRRTKLLLWYTACLRILSVSGFDKKPDESPLAFACRVENVPFTTLCEQVTLVVFGHRPIDTQVLSSAATCYAQLFAKLHMLQKIHAISKQMLVFHRKIL